MLFIIFKNGKQLYPIRNEAAILQVVSTAFSEIITRVKPTPNHCETMQKLATFVQTFEQKYQKSWDELWVQKFRRNLLETEGYQKLTDNYTKKTFILTPATHTHTHIMLHS